MISIKTTPHLYGITLQGDYQDLNALYDSISRYLNFYSENSETWPYHEFEYMLSLNYDIRHAYMGTRGVSFAENNAESIGRMAEVIFEIPDGTKQEWSKIRKQAKAGNLFFHVEILYPLVFHYLTTLQSILDDYLLPGENTKTLEYVKYYTELEANHDRAQIQHFVSLLWDNLIDLFGHETALIFYRYCDNLEYLYPAYSMYTDALLHCQDVCFKSMTPEEKKAFLTVSFFEILDAETLTDSPDECQSAADIYNSASAILKKQNHIFPSRDSFFMALDEFARANQPLYRDKFESFLNNQYGGSDDKSEPDW